MRDLGAPVSERVRLDDIDEAAEALRRGEAAGRPIIVF